MLFGAGLALSGCLCGCRTAPITGRRQLLLYPEGNELSLGETAFGDLVGKATESTRQEYSSLVSQVGQRIAAVSGRKDYQWEFKTLVGQEQNAFCLPGGKVAVYEGMMPICQNEAGLAVVMSHEIAHALARHGGERMSQNTAVEGVKTAVGYVMQNQDQLRKDLMLRAYGVATEYGVLLPYSRKHESEADNIGLMLMAQAGYDPEEAPRFWTRFGAAGSGTKQPEFLSTHPSDERRAADLVKLLPQAQALYSHAPTKSGLGQSINA
jgi:predicted Zn-dependent protease